MSATFHTKNLNLPQFCENDIPQWLGDVNPAFKAIDDNAGTTAENVEQATQLGQQGIDDAAAAQATADEANKRSQDNAEAITALQTTTADHEQRITKAESDITQNASDISTNAKNIAQNADNIAKQQTKIGELDTRLGTAEDNIKTIQGDIVNIGTKDAQQDADIAQNAQDITVLEANALTLNPADRIMRNGQDVKNIVFPDEAVISGVNLAVKGLEAPEDDGDATRKAYVDNLVGDVDKSVTELETQLATANETITTLQQSLAALTERVTTLEGKAESELSMTADYQLQRNGVTVDYVKVNTGYYAGDKLIASADDSVSIGGAN